MQKQYVIQKYVLAKSVEEAMKKSKKSPIHEVYVHNSWFEKQNYEFFNKTDAAKVGFRAKQK